MILVDSHVVVWLAMDSDRSTSRARKFIRDERATGQGLAISSISQELPAEFPNDPGDRLIGATAWAEDMVLVTADRAIRRCAALRTVW